MYFMLPVHLLTSKRVWISIRNLFRTLSVPRVPCMCVKPTTLCLKLQCSTTQKKTVQITLQRSPAWPFLHIDRTIKIVAIRSSQREKEKIEKMSIATLRNCRNSCSLSWLKMQCATVHIRSDSNRAASALSSLFRTRARSLPVRQPAAANRIEKAGTKPVLLSPDPGTSFLPPSNSNVALDFANISTVAQLYTPCQELFSSFSFIFIIASSCCAARSLSSLLWRRVWAVLQYINMPCCWFFFVMCSKEGRVATRRRDGKSNASSGEVERTENLTFQVRPSERR